MQKIAKLGMVFLMVLSLILTFAACTKQTVQKTESQPKTVGNQNNQASTADTAVKDTGKKITIGVSQTHMNTPYRVALISQIKEAVKAKNLDWEIVTTDGQNNATKQINDVEDLIARKCDLIIMSPTQSEPLTPVAKKVMDAGIPLILVDRTISSEDYTTFVGGDNVHMGKAAAESIAKALNGKGNVVEMEGTLGASATIDKHKGFRDEISKYPGIKVIVDQSGDYKRDKGMTLMEDILQANPKIDAVYFHNDNMALGALQAIQAAKRDKGMILIGGDGMKEALDRIKDGSLTATGYYPTGAKEAIDLAEKILKGEKVEKKYKLDTPLITKDNLDQFYPIAF